MEIDKIKNDSYLYVFGKDDGGNQILLKKIFLEDPELVLDFTSQVMPDKGKKEIRIYNDDNTYSLLYDFLNVGDTNEELQFAFLNDNEKEYLKTVFKENGLD